ncbi:MAG: hypothetical protein PVJ71_04965 [Lysobacterales bacterium]|jgi:hypothetical protein
MEAKQNSQNHTGLWAAIAEFVLLAMLMVAVPLVVALDVMAFKHGVQEISATEFAQEGLLLLSAVLLALTARARPDARGFLVLVAGFFSVMLIREADMFFDFISQGFWVYPALAVSVGVIAYASRQRGTVIPPIPGLVASKWFAYLAIGLLLVLVFSRAFGTGQLWSEVMGEDYRRIYKSVIQEGIELLGYVLVFFGALGTFLQERKK